MGRGDRRDAAAAWIVVLAVQAMTAAWLVRLHPPIDTGDEADALIIEFVRRPEVHASAARAVSPRAHVAHEQAAREIPGRRRRVADVPERNAEPEPEAAKAPLDLNIPVQDSLPARNRDAFDRASPIEPRRTRFDAVWVPDADALRQAAFRSPAVGVVTDLFGGPPRRCSEVERRLRKANCLPLHGQEAEDERLRRGLNP